MTTPELPLILTERDRIRRLRGQGWAAQVKFGRQTTPTDAFASHTVKT